MRKVRFVRISIVVTVISTALIGCSRSVDLSVLEPTQISNVIDGVTFESGNWDPFLPAGEAGSSWGNHRAVVKVDTSAEAVWAHIQWRRHDRAPEDKSIIVVDAATEQEITDLLVVRSSAESGDIVFRPNEGSETYHIYYFPYETNGGYYPRVWYPTRESAADAQWLASIQPVSAAERGRFPAANVERIQSVDEFHSFFPMEITATAEETERLLSVDERSFYLFPEDRLNPIRMRNQLPHHWATRGMTDSFDGAALKGEYYTLQIGVFAARGDLSNVDVSFSDFTSSAGGVIEASQMTCFNTDGIDLLGQPFVKSVSVPEGEIQPLWIGVQVPADARPGKYVGSIGVEAEGVPGQSIRVELQIVDAKAQSRGDDEPENMTRLRWLNSTVGTDPDFIIDPFIPVTVKGRVIHILGRDIALGDNGLPESILSYYTPELTGFAEEPGDIITRPLELSVLYDGGIAEWVSEPFEITQEDRGSAVWTSLSKSEIFNLKVEGRIEYEGMLDYRMTLTAKEDIRVDDIALPVAYAPDAATYILGLGHKGQKRTGSIDWKWKKENHHEGVWMGGVHKGLQYVLRDENYERPLNTNFYQAKPLNMPPSWFNQGRGGIRIEAGQAEVLATNYSGAREVRRGEELHFGIRFLVTPFKPIDTETHFNTRFVHKYVPVDSVLTWGGTVVNIHHANEINPYINYPFFNLDLQTAYVDEAHAKGIKVKLYNTIRELTYRSHELFALRSLGDEILNDGEGGGHSWLQEHLQEGYHSAWHAFRVDDAAILNKGTSRWTNYYIEGLNWLAKNQEIDGLYLDDIAFSRETVKRMISVLNQHRDEVVIDLHSANQFNPRDGFINSAMLYMEHFPFISRLWFGEYFEYDLDEDYWMTEVSGLPFGLMGEMLQDGGHPYRGMLYGMTTRMYGDIDPRPVWNLMNEFCISESRMLGYWLDSNPVSTDNARILATTYVREDGVLVALASWAPEDTEVRLEIDWEMLGMDPSAVRLMAPLVEGLQKEQELSTDSPVLVPGELGLFVLIDNI